MIITIGIVLRYVELHAKDNRYWLSLVAQDSRKLKFPLLFHLQVSNVVYEQYCLNYLKVLLRDFGIFFLFVWEQILLVGLASLMVWLSTTHRTEKHELLVLHQLMNWSIAGILFCFYPFARVAQSQNCSRMSYEHN